MNIRLLPILAGALVFAGCGGGGSSGTPQTAPDTGASDVITFGTITRFGSVYANGQVFECANAMVTMNDEPGVLAELRVGHIVAIRADVRAREQHAVARTIGCLDEAVGPVSDLDLDRHRFVVLGQTIHFDELTVFENAPYDQLANGNVVRVTGHERHANRIQATHIRRIANTWTIGTQMKVKGTIEDLDAGLMRFRIGTQWCDYSSAMLELGGAALGDGLYAEVRSAAPVTGGELLADLVRARDRDRDRERDRLCDAGCSYEIEGYITEFVSPLEFVVDGTTVTTTDTTVYINGTAESLALDARIAVAGHYDAEGLLVASKIVFPLPSVVQIAADVEAVDLEEATVTALGIRVTTSDSTMFRDATDGGVREFWLDDLAIGDRVTVRAYLDGGTVVAARLEREDADDTVTLKAPVEAIDRPALTLLGVTVTAQDTTVFQAADQSVIDADTFFALVEAGTLVRAIGTYSGGTVLADGLFIRECADSCL